MMIYSENKKTEWLVLEWGLTLLINAFVLLMATKIFKDFEIQGFWYAVLAALIIMILNKTIKPIIKLLMMPLTIFTLGLFYPFINVIILKLASLFMGDKFVIEGWIVPFFISIFISIMTIMLDAIITKQLIGGQK